MARRNKRKNSPEQLILTLALAIGTAFSALVLFRPGMSLQAMVVRVGVVTAILAVLGLVGYLYLKSVLAPKPVAPERSFSARTARTPTAFGVSQSSPTLEAAIAEAMRPREQSAQRPAATTFSEETLRRMDWLAFEHLVVEMFRYLGFTPRKTGAGADGGVDIELHDPRLPPEASLKALIQCKARGTSSVGVDKARELYGVMAARKVSRGVLICNTWFSPDAVAFGKANPTLQMGDLPWFLKQLGKVSEIEREKWEKQFLGPDYDVPSCPACEIKLVRRTGKQGEFWGCLNYPRGCRSKIPMRNEAKQGA